MFATHCSSRLGVVVAGALALIYRAGRSGLSPSQREQGSCRGQVGKK
jgi:hypothetical protein